MPDPSLQDIAHDKKHWEAFAAALAALKISTYEISYLVQLMAAVLHLGNLDFIQAPEIAGPCGCGCGCGYGLG